MKLSGTCGSVSVRLIPAPRGTGLVAAPASKKILAMAGLEVSSCVQQPMRPSARRGGGPAIRGRRVDDAKRQLTPLHAGLLLHDARPLAHDGQLYYRRFQRGLGLLRLLVARVMEAYG